MDTDIHSIEPRPLELYPTHMPDVKGEPVDVPMCENVINDRVNWMDLTKLLVRESVISYIINLKKGFTDMKDLKTTISGVVAVAAQIAKIFGLEIPNEILDAVSVIATAVGLYFAKDKPATPAA